MIHVKRSNPHSGYRGIQPTFVAGCQEVTNPEIAPVKLQFVTRERFNHAYQQDPATCCPSCALYAKVVTVARVGDELFYNTLMSNAEGTLEGVLYHHTKGLLTIFLAHTAEAADRMFSFYEEINALSYDQLVERYPHTYISRYDKKESVVLSRDGSRIRDKARSANRLGKGAFAEKMQDAARQHYIDATLKLAFRLRQKGVEIGDNVTVSSERIDGAGNIAIQIKSDKGVVRAWTIIASGPVVAPHYRYLIK